jgi:hypothetical protein
MCPFERPTLERCLQVSCVALAPSVMLASVQLLARTQGKNPQETPDFLSHDTDRWALRYTLYMHDYGGPVGLERIQRSTLTGVIVN